MLLKLELDNSVCPINFLILANWYAAGQKNDPSKQVLERISANMTHLQTERYDMSPFKVNWFNV
jgi:hypothetical protein